MLATLIGLGLGLGPGLAAVAWAPAAEQSSTPACDLRVLGRVVDAATAEPVFDAHVRVRATDDEGAGAEVLTDASGRFSVGPLCPGAHSVAVERADYEAKRRTVTLRSAASPLEIDFVLEPRDVVRLDDVVVQAPAAGQSQLGASATLSGDALDRARDQGLASTIEKLPGVSVLRSGSGAPGKPIIRGQFGRRNLILHDRVRHHAQSWGLDHAPEVDPFSAGQITVIKGASALQYGADAVGGVVLIDPPPMPEQPGVSGMARLIGVSNGLRGTAAARVQGAHTTLPGFSWRAEANTTRGRAPRTPDYPLDNTGLSMWNAGGKIGWRRRWFSLTTSYRRHSLRGGLCTCLRNDVPDEFSQAAQLGAPVGSEAYQSQYAIERAYQGVNHDLAIVRAAFDLGTAGTLTATYSFQNNARDEFDVVRDGISGPQLSLSLQTDVAELSFEHDPVALGGQLSLAGTAGASYLHQRNRFVSNNTLVPDYDQDAGAVFAIERLVARRWEVHAGARYDGMTRKAALSERDYAGQDAQGRLDPSICTPDPNGGGRCEPSFHAASGTLGGLVRAVQREAHELTVELDLTSGARMPAVDEQFINGGAPSFPVLAVGSSRLGVERVWGQSLTVGYDGRVVSTEAGGYANVIDDYIDFRAEPQTGPCAPLTCTVRGPFPVFAFQATRAVFYGLDYGLLVAPPAWPVSVDARLALVRARDTANDRFVAFVPADRYSLEVAYQWPDVWRLRRGTVALQGTFVDRQRRSDPTTDFAPPPPAVFRLGAAASVELPLGNQVLSMGLSGANLTNARYREYASLMRYFADQPGWEVSLRLGVDFTAGPRAKPRR